MRLRTATPPNTRRWGLRCHFSKSALLANAKSTSEKSSVDKCQFSKARIIDRNLHTFAGECFNSLESRHTIRLIVVPRWSILCEVDTGGVKPLRTGLTRGTDVVAGSYKAKLRDQERLLTSIIQRTPTYYTSRANFFRTAYEAITCGTNSIVIDRPISLRLLVQSATGPDMLCGDDLCPRSIFRNSDTQVTLKLDFRSLRRREMIGLEFYHIGGKTVLGEHVARGEKTKQRSTINRTGYPLAVLTQTIVAFVRCFSLQLKIEPEVFRHLHINTLQKVEHSISIFGAQPTPVLDAYSFLHIPCWDDASKCFLHRLGFCLSEGHQQLCPAILFLIGLEEIPQVSELSLFLIACVAEEGGAKYSLHMPTHDFFVCQHDPWRVHTPGNNPLWFLIML